jgi:hypothetical protein
LVLARRLTGLQVADDPQVWSAMGFTVDGTSVVVGGVHVQLRGAEDGARRGLTGWSFEPPWPTSIDGLPVGSTSAAAGPTPADRTHPNGASAVDHVVVASPDVERTTAALGTAGIEPRRTVVGARGDDDVLYRFFLLGTCVLELIGPAVATGDGPARFVGLAFTTDAIDGLGDAASAPRPAVQPGRRIATVRRELGSSLPIAFLSPRR